ncbi:peptidoglycan editing factor PgeF [Ruminococcus sp. OA3]|uniref:peptidoglycan editing factor PgeF n=1 Tax=Ruminococcus sp. OA3 TaxID=2914164 RepID=UPI0031F505E9
MLKIKWHHSEEEKMAVNHKGELCYLTWPMLSSIPFVKHAFTTRFGGVSEGVLSSMNLSFTRGDREGNVRENFRRIAEAVGFHVEDIVCSDQTHTANVRIVTEQDRGKGVIRDRDYADVDGLVTNVPGIMLATFYADCVPLYLVDPVNQAVGLSHSGWKGTVSNIAKATLKAMKHAYGTNPKDVIAAIGPSICQDCYEISEDVAAMFKNAYPAANYRDMIVDKKNGKYQLDLWKACSYNFMQAGVMKDHIVGPNLCTCCNPEILFSHRASNGKRGNLAAFLGISH